MEICRCLLTILGCLLGCLLVSSKLRAQGYSPAEAAGKMTVPPGFEVQLVASEPTITQPVAIEFDRRGRLWVLQYIQYPNPAGLARARVDRYSRTVYDRIPEPPPRGPRGSDRVTILEDEDDDGVYESSKDFISGLNLTTGIAFGHGGVFLLQVPYLLFYPDRDRNDVPDSDPEVLLTGFGMEDAHSVANSLTWGPDGWLYGCQGSTVTAKIRGIEFQQGVWRYHPITRDFELFCEGGGNSWGLDFDKHGNLFYSTNNGPFCMLHGVQGGYYWKSFGKHGALHNPHTYGYFEHVVHEGFRGGHVTVGGIIYQGASFPPEMRDQYIGANLLAHDVYWHTIVPHGSSFTSRHAGELLHSNDTWFAPSDVTMGPDGAIYVADWHDARTAHPDPDAEWDRSNGRIYRIAARKTKREPVRDLDKLSGVELLEVLEEPNDWYARRAREILAERRDPKVIEPLRDQLLQHAPDANAPQALWSLYVSGSFDESLGVQLLAHPDEDVRWWSVRFLGDQKHVEKATAAALARAARSDESLRVRSQLASTAKRLPAAAALPILSALLLRDDASDIHLPLLLWWGIEAKTISDREMVLGEIATPEIWRTKLGRDEIMPRLIRRYAAEGGEADYAMCATLLRSAPGPRERERLLEGLRLGLAGRILDGTPAPLRFLAAELLETNELPALTLAIQLGNQDAIGRALDRIGDDSIPFPERQSLAQALSERRDRQLVESLLPKLHDDEPAVLGMAIDLLATYSDPRITEQVLDVYGNLAPALKWRGRDLLFARPESALAFLQKVDAGVFPKEDVPLEQLQTLAVHRDSRIQELVTKHWGSVQAATPEEVLAEIRRLNNDLRARKGEATAGKLVFEKRCSSCHQLFGAGNKIGPDLTTANRKDRDYLLVSLVDPSAVIRKEYLSFAISTMDGRVLTGLLVAQTPAAVTLLDAKNQRTVLPTSTIEEIAESTVSLMPANLYKELSPEELRNLFAYLQSEPSP